MARKFLYFIAFCVVLMVAAVITWNYWQRELTQLAFVPGGEFEAPAPLVANAYEDPAMWLSRPGMGAKNPAMWKPDGFVEDGDAWTAAVFFVHPTSHLTRKSWNAPLDDAEANERARLFVQAMASPFNKTQDIWAPRYRQAALGAFLTDEPSGKLAMDLAYDDVLKAFDYFLASIDPGQPIILAGHSQGSLILHRLLRDRVAGTPLAARIAAVYPIGWPLSLDHDLPALGLPACATPSQAGCIMTWGSFGEPVNLDQKMALGYAASAGLDGQQRGESEILCTNPLTGGIGGEAPASANLGTLRPNEDMSDATIEPGLVPARCDKGLLLIGPPIEMGPGVLPGNNYHVYDIPLFWANLRADAGARLAAWKPPVR